jgi:hypothetical protein
MKPFGADNNLDVLQNIEFQIVEAYRANEAITDFDVTDALEALTRHYTAEAAEKQPSAISLDPRAQAVYRNVREICEWRLGRAEGGPLLGLIDLPGVISALRTIMKSIRRWSGRGGKRGYLDFVKNYLP